MTSTGIFDRTGIAPAASSSPNSGKNRATTSIGTAAFMMAVNSTSFGEPPSANA